MRTTVRLLMMLAVVAACTDDDEDGPLDTWGFGIPGAARTTSVIIRDFTFIPDAIRVVPGATVTFTNTDNIEHNVTFASASIADIVDWASGGRSTVMPAVTGTYNYVCTIHPGMSGRIQVASDGAAAAR